MRRYVKIASVSILMMGLLAVPNLSQATDGSLNQDRDGRHRLLNAELRSKIEHLGNKIAEHREHQGGIPRSLETLQTEVDSLKASLATANAQLLTGCGKTLVFSCSLGYIGITI
jgi:septal ring factor EnvC (AmiA/AmiB activator)